MLNPSRLIADHYRQSVAPVSDRLFSSPFAPSRLIADHDRHSVVAAYQAAYPKVAAKVCSYAENAVLFQFGINFYVSLLTDFKKSCTNCIIA